MTLDSLYYIIYVKFRSRQMKKIWMYILPIWVTVLVVLSGCGCKPTILKFSETRVDLVLNSLNDETTVVKLVSNENLADVTLTYNKSIISYDLDTGVVKAQGEGETILRAKLGSVEAYVEVNVTKNYFASNFTIKASDSYTIRNLDDASEATSFNLLERIKKDYKALSKYNLNYSFRALPTPTGVDVLTVDPKTGVVTPIGTGEQYVEITVASGIKDGEILYDTQKIKIVVKAPCSTLDLTILDQDGRTPINFTTINDINTYQLEQGRWYIVKISADGELHAGGTGITLTDKLYDENWAEIVDIDNRSKYVTNGPNDTLYNYYQMMDGGSVSCRTFIPKKNCYWQEHFEDSAQNCHQSILSNIIKIEVVSRVECSLLDSLEPDFIGPDDENVFWAEPNGEFSWAFSVENGDFENIEVIAEPSEGISLSYDFSQSNVVSVSTTNFDELYTIIVRDKSDELNERAFVYQFRVWESLGEETFVTLVNNSQNELELPANDFLRFYFTEKYNTGLVYALKVYIDSDLSTMLTDDEVSALFEYEVKYESDMNRHKVSINLKQNSTEEGGEVSIVEHLATYYLKLVAKTTDTTNFVSPIITLKIIDTDEQGGGE